MSANVKKESIVPLAIVLVLGTIVAMLRSPAAATICRSRHSWNERASSARASRSLSESGRAEVSPGEAASVSWIVAGPGAPATLDWAFALCTTAGGDCKDAPQPIATGSGAPVTVAFATPDAATLGTDQLPLMLGVVCANGAIGFDPNTALGTCTGAGASGTTVRFVVPVTPASKTPNHHPVFTNDVFEIGGAPWDTATATAAAPGDACDATTGLPTWPRRLTGKTRSSKRSGSSATATTARRSRPPARPCPSSRTCRNISNFATAGKFESSYAAIFATDLRPDADVTVKWEPPAARTVGGGGEVVAFHFVVRDLRGGLDVASRSLCLVGR